MYSKQNSWSLLLYCIDFQPYSTDSLLAVNPEFSFHHICLAYLYQISQSYIVLF